MRVENEPGARVDGRAGNALGRWRSNKVQLIWEDHVRE